MKLERKLINSCFDTCAGDIKTVDIVKGVDKTKSRYNFNEYNDIITMKVPWYRHVKIRQ